MQGRERGHENLKWNTDLIETMELEYVMSQAAQYRNDGERPPRQRESQAHERDEVQWTKHASRSDSKAQQRDLTSRGGVLVERVCVSNVHMTCPPPPTQRNHKGWRSAPDAILPGHRKHPSGVPARTPTVHWGLYNGRPWVARHQRHKCEVKMQ